MAHILSNKLIELQIEEPFDHYKFPRFDQTGLISAVRYKGINVSTRERPFDQDDQIHGKGFYSEFGLSEAIGFSETDHGDWFHKIGVGLLQKDTDAYDFLHPYACKPAQFNIEASETELTTTCKSLAHNGYQYRLQKHIALEDSGFSVVSTLINEGDKEIVTAEYNHNFVAINDEPIDERYRLLLPFTVDPKSFDEYVDQEGVLSLKQKSLGFNRHPHEPFFVSNLTGGKPQPATWEIQNTRLGIGISETASFETKKVNVWGWQHVLSPELFFDIHLKSGDELTWTRRYSFE